MRCSFGAARLACIRDSARSLIMVATSHFSQPNNWEVYRQRTQAFAAGKDVGAVSGIGSTQMAAKPLVKWLLAWLATSDVKSMVEASCGHWPSGWQAGVRWPHLSYTGVDLLKEQVDANAALVSKRGAASFGLTNATFQVGSMTMVALPTADLLFTKDTLIHLPLADINHFLDLSVRGCPARFRYVIFVQEMAKNITTNVEISRRGHHALDFAVPPFSLNVTTVFTYPSGRCCRKSVQLLDLSRASACVPRIGNHT